MVVYRPVASVRDSNQTVSDQVWYELYSTLRPYILGWVYSSGVSSWHGQEQDVTDDILQEAVIRTLKYMRLVENGQGHPIHSVTCFGRTVAHNHFRDLRRRELRLLRPFGQDDDSSLLLLSRDEVDPAEIALDRVMRISLLMHLARIIVAFPTKQRCALLTDIANQEDVSDDSNPLLRAFAASGVDLREYRRVLPADPLERSRHAASLSMAYKRLRQAFKDRFLHYPY